MNKGKVKIHGKDYATVAFRVTEFRKKYPKYSITTEIIERPGKEALLEEILFRAYILDDERNIVACGHAHEEKASSYINKSSYVENCETSAIGRALACFGFCGEEFGCSYSSANEVAIAKEKQEKIKTIEMPSIEEQIETAEKQGLVAFYYASEIPSKYKIIAAEESAVELGKFDLFGFNFPYEDMARDLIMLRQRDGKWIGSRQYLHKLQDWDKIPPDAREKIVYILEKTK